MIHAHIMMVEKQAMEVFVQLVTTVLEAQKHRYYVLQESTALFLSSARGWPVWRVTTALEITLNMSPAHVHKGISVLMARPSHTNSLVHQEHTTTEHDGQG